MTQALARVAALLRRIVGAPDYDAYLRHIAEYHPGSVPQTEREFLDERLVARYSRAGSRCC